MFEVKGWTISAPLKQQTESIPPPDLTSIEIANQTKKSRKRKRNKDDATITNAGVKRKEHGEEEKSNESKKQKKEHGNDMSVARGEDAEETSKLAKKSKKQHKAHTNGDGQTSESQRTTRSANSLKAKEKTTKTASPRSPDENAHSKSQQPSQPTWLTSTTTDKHLTPLQRSMRDKLIGARFRHINETMYTSSNSSNLALFSQHPDMWRDYHAGFSQQVQSWPENPIDHFIAECRVRAKIPSGKNARRGDVLKPLLSRGSMRTVIDMGCGDAKFARAFDVKERKALKLQVRSFDLNSTHPEIEVADCGTGLPNVALESVSVVIICLALMGTDWTAMIDEAWRVLERGGELWIAEIKSRFVRTEGKAAGKGVAVAHSVGKKRKKGKLAEKDKMAKEQADRENEETLAREVDGAASVKDSYRDDQTDVSAFVHVLEGRGFVLDGGSESAVDLRNKMFVKFRFVKSGDNPTRGKNAQAAARVERKGKVFLEMDEQNRGESDNEVLKPCLYKTR